MFDTVQRKTEASPTALDAAEKSPGRDTQALKAMTHAQGQAALTPPQVQDALAYNQANFQDAAVIGRIQAYFGLGTPALEPATVEAVAGFQAGRGLAPDGKIGPRTWRALKPETGAPDAAKLASAADVAPAAQPAAKLPEKQKQAKAETANDKGAQAAPPQKAELPAAAATAAPATAATPVPAQGGPLKKAEVVDAMAKYRQQPIDPQWVARFQAALGVGVTGAVTEATLQAFAQRQVDEGAKKPEPKFWTSSGRALAAKMFPDLSVKEQAFAAKAAPRAKGQDVSDLGAEDAAVRQHGYGGMSDYVSKFQTLQFMGKSVVGHALFIERLQMAQRFLAGKFPDKSDGELGKLFGVTTVSHYRPSTAANPQAYHGLGFAIDFNPANNPWILGKSSGKSAENLKETAEIIARASRFMGYGEAVDLGVLKSLGANATTDDAFDRLEASSRALREYRAMAKNRELVAAHLDGATAPADIKAQGVDHWFKQIQYDHLAYAKRNWKKGNKEDGLMDLNKTLVQAMRDAAGLSWGFIDMGDASGDIMHFDGRFIGLANDIRRARDKADKG